MPDNIDKMNVASITQKIAEIDTQLNLLYLVRFKNVQINEEDNAYNDEGDVYIDEKGNEKTINDGRSQHHNLFIELVNKKNQLKDILHHNLFKELVSKKHQLELPKNQKEPESSLIEKIHQGLVWGSIVTISGFIVGIFRDLANIFSAVIGAVIVLGSNIASFAIQGLLSLWDLVLIAADKITGQNQIERSKSKILTGIIMIGLTLFALLVLAKIIVIAGIAAPFIIPGIFMSISALNLYHENRKYERIQEKKIENKNNVDKLENQLNSILEKYISENKEIKELNIELGQIEFDLCKDPKSIVIAKEKEAKQIQFIKKLYDIKEVYTAAEALHAAKMEKEILEINEKYSANKRKALIKSIIGTVFLISGVGISFLLPPLGLIFSGIGFAMLGNNYNEHRKLREKEKIALKKHEKDNEFKSIAIMESIEHNFKNTKIPKIRKAYSPLETKPSEPLPKPKDSHFIDAHEQTLKNHREDRPLTEAKKPYQPPKTLLSDHNRSEIGLTLYPIIRRNI